MTLKDPFSGRAASEGAPYDNALTITPDDAADLPVIPSAIYVPLWSQDAEGQPIQNAYPADRNGSEKNVLSLEMQNGERLTMHLPSYVDLQGSAPIILPVRPNKILRTGTTLHRVTLLW